MKRDRHILHKDEISNFDSYSSNSDEDCKYKEETKKFDRIKLNENRSNPVNLNKKNYEVQEFFHSG